MLHAVKPFIDFYRVASFSSPVHGDGSGHRIWRGVSLGWNAARRYRRLASLNDDQLRRIGLDRASIGRYAFFGSDAVADPRDEGQ